ncbi:MAG TPA: InlB B-repeat-containing protein [Clostridia bacterium]
MKKKFNFEGFLLVASYFLIAMIIHFVFIYGFRWNKNYSDKEYSYGYYLYRYSYNEYGETRVRITGLTEAGKEQEILIIPEKINDIKVEEISSGSKKAWISNKLKKLYLPKNYLYCTSFSGCPNLEAVIIINFEKNDYLCEDLSIWSSFSGIYCYYPADAYFSKREENRQEAARPANVAFVYNYENAPNNIYWVDIVPYGAKINFIPEDPQREGYRFVGWYKEPECINKWDFEIDSVPEALLDDEGEEIFQEKRLYAKWDRI